jgi:outer membrane protein
MLNKKNLLILISVIFFLSDAYSQANWNLQKCVDYALENNLTIKQTKLNVSLADVDLEQSKYSVLPSLNASASENYSWGRSRDPVTNLYQDIEISSNNFSLNSSATLFAGFQKINSIKQNKLELQAEKYNLEKIQNDISLTVVTFYLNVLFNQELLQISKGQLEISKEQLARAEKNAAVGNLTQGDVLQQRAQVATDELNVTNAQNQLDISKLDLMQLLDLDPSQYFEIERPANLDALAIVNMGYTARQVYDTAAIVLPDVKLADTRYEAAKRGLAVARGGLYPSLTLNGGISTDYSSIQKRINGDSTGLESIPFNDQVNDNLGQFVGVTLNIPIFNGHSSHSNVKRAKINLANAEINTQITKNNLNKTITQSVADLNAAEKKYDAANNSYESLKEAFKYDQQKFDVGLINSVDFNISKNNLAKAESDRLQAKYDLIFRSKVLDFYMGKSLSF